MNKKRKIVRFIPKGGFYSMTAYDCYTLKQTMEQYNLKRSDISEWWKENIKR